MIWSFVALSMILTQASFSHDGELHMQPSKRRFSQQQASWVFSFYRKLKDDQGNIFRMTLDLSVFHSDSIPPELKASVQQNLHAQVMEGSFSDFSTAKGMQSFVQKIEKKIILLHKKGILGLEAKRFELKR